VVLSFAVVHLAVCLAAVDVKLEIMNNYFVLFIVIFCVELLTILSLLFAV